MRGKKLTELDKAIRAVEGVLGLMAGPGSDMDTQWQIVKKAAAQGSGQNCSGGDAPTNKQSAQCSHPTAKSVSGIFICDICGSEVPF